MTDIASMVNLLLCTDTVHVIEVIKGMYYMYVTTCSSSSGSVKIHYSVYEAMPCPLFNHLLFHDYVQQPNGICYAVIYYTCFGLPMHVGFQHLIKWHCFAN